MPAHEELERSAKMLRETADQVRRSRQHISGWTHGSDARRAEELEAQARKMDDMSRREREKYVNWLWGY